MKESEGISGKESEGMIREGKRQRRNERKVQEWAVRARHG